VVTWVTVIFPDNYHPTNGRIIVYSFHYLMLAGDAAKVGNPYGNHRAVVHHGKLMSMR
jgi:hypothetical protein